MKKSKIMIRNIFIVTLVCATALIVASCGKSARNEAAEGLREAEAAVALGDMEAASSVATKVIGPENLSNLSATELARLSIVYMQIADRTERESSIAQAADLYRRAFASNPDSAAAFYADVNPDLYPYVTMLKTLVGHLDNPYNPEADSLGEIHDDHFPEIADSIH